MAARGYAHPETAAAYERAVAIAGDDPVRFGVARTGLAICHNNRGAVERGRALAVEVQAAAETRGDTEQAVVGHGVVATAEHFQGKFASSLAHCERAIALYDPARHHGHFRVLGNDYGITALNFAAWNLWALGRPDAALEPAREAASLARGLDDPFSLAFAICFETFVHWHRRDVAAVRARAAEVVALREAQGFPLWLGLGRMLHAAAGVVAGDATGLSEVTDGLALAAQTGNQLSGPSILAILAEVQLAAGRLAEAQDSVATALTAASHTGQTYFDADLHRLGGDLLLATGGAAEEALGRYRRALTIARDQEARSLELRAGMSLARLWRDQGNRAAARAALAPVYATFDEGFATRDLQDAQALLAELR
jgi:predicted ATPase